MNGMSHKEVAPRASVYLPGPGTAAAPSEHLPSAAMPLPGTWPAGKPGYADTVGAYSCRPRTPQPQQREEQEPQGILLGTLSHWPEGTPPMMS